MRVLVFAAHPDDDVIGCGGSIIKHKKSGDDVTVVFMTSGDSGSIKIPKTKLAKIRENESKAASKLTGARLIFLKQPDGYLEYSKKMLIEVTNLIRKIRPHWVYVHHKNDKHPDHQATFKIVDEGVRRAGDTCFPECLKKPWCVERVLGYEVWTPITDFNYVQDISKVMELKLKAIKAHESQVEQISYHDAVMGLNKYRGIMCGKGKFCEVFEVIRF